MRTGRPLRVLIADDNEDIVLTLTAILEDEGYEVRQVRDGRQAIVEVAEFDPDAVVADLKMPALSGWDLARAVRRTGEQGRPLLIAMSGQYTKGADRVLSEIAGFNHFLPKPFQPSELLALLEPLKPTAT